jgi:hypothetical protein
MGFVLVYAVFVSSVLTGYVTNKKLDQVADRIRAEEIPPIVVPQGAGLPDLTASSEKSYKKFVQTHVYENGKWRKV